MRLSEKLFLKAVSNKLHKSLNVKEIPHIPVPTVKDHLDIEYKNRSGKTLYMDIFEPTDHEPEYELPVIINVHGGGLIGGCKENSQTFCRLLAEKGYLVFSLEYRLVPEIRVFEQFDDVCAGMDLVGRKLVDFNVDITRIYMVAESAGAYLSLYVAAMRNSKELQEAINYPPTKVRVKAMALIGGMFYTTKKDKTGIFLSKSFYGKDDRSIAMAKYTNPEHPEIINNIPPLFLITSKADMLERYTLDFASELGNKGVPHKLRLMGNNPQLIHAFPILRPDLPESRRVIKEIDEYFNEYK